MMSTPPTLPQDELATDPFASPISNIPEATPTITVTAVKPDTTMPQPSSAGLPRTTSTALSIVFRDPNHQLVNVTMKYANFTVLELKKAAAPLIGGDMRGVQALWYGEEIEDATVVDMLPGFQVGEEFGLAMVCPMKVMSPGVYGTDDLPRMPQKTMSFINKPTLTPCPTCGASTTANCISCNAPICSLCIAKTMVENGARGGMVLDPESPSGGGHVILSKEESSCDVVPPASLVKEKGIFGRKRKTIQVSMAECGPCAILREKREVQVSRMRTLSTCVVTFLIMVILVGMALFCIPSHSIHGWVGKF